MPFAASLPAATLPAKRAMAACLASLATAAAGQAPAAQPAPVDLRCNFTDPELRAAASAVIDDVWAEVDRWLGPAANSAARLTMFVWGDVASCKAATAKLPGGGSVSDEPQRNSRPVAAGHTPTQRGGVSVHRCPRHERDKLVRASEYARPRRGAAPPRFPR